MVSQGQPLWGAPHRFRRPWGLFFLSADFSGSFFVSPVPVFRSVAGPLFDGPKSSLKWREIFRLCAAIPKFAFFIVFRCSSSCPPSIIVIIEYASVAQLDRAFGSDPEGRWFESSRAHQNNPRTKPEIMGFVRGFYFSAAFLGFRKFACFSRFFAKMQVRMQVKTK